MLQHNFDSVFILLDMSDHLPAVALLKQTKFTDKNPIEFLSRKLNDEKIKKINAKLHDIDWNGNLNSEDCNINFNKPFDLLHHVMDEVSPIVQIRISGKRRYTEPWMTTGIETSNQQNLKLYKETLKPGSMAETLKKYKEHFNILNCVKCRAKMTYYNAKCNEYKTNAKKFGR